MATEPQDAVQKYDRLMQLGYIVPAPYEPFASMMPSAYVSVPTTLAFSTPSVKAAVDSAEAKNAKLGIRSKGNKKRARRQRNG